MPTKEQYEAFFNQADTDGSKELTLDELVNALKKNGFCLTDGQFKSYFKTMDKSNDGKVSLNEYLEAMGAIPEDRSKEAQMRGVFNEFDTDGNKKIDKKELTAFFKEMGKCFSEQEITRMMELMDKGTGENAGDGYVDFEEFIEYYFNRK